jgi:hypothetical protein
MRSGKKQSGFHLGNIISPEYSSECVFLRQVQPTFFLTRRKEHYMYGSCVIIVKRAVDIKVMCCGKYGGYSLLKE